MKTFRFTAALVAAFAGSYAVTSMISAYDGGLNAQANLLATQVLMGSTSDVVGEPFSATDPDGYLRFDSDDYSVSVSPDVSLDVLGTSVITKIQGGHLTKIQVVQTPTGVYSTDGLASPHVRYPGIWVSMNESQVTGGAWALTESGWTPLPTTGNSLVYLHQPNGTGANGPCLADNGVTVCR